MKDQFNTLTIADVRRETPDTVSYALDVPADLQTAYTYKPGQHVVVRAKFDGDEIRRTYSISSGPNDTHLWITVKGVDGGLFSTHAHETWDVGSSIEAMPPSGRFVTPAAGTEGRTFLAVTAGSGITPISAIIDHMLSSEPDSRFILIYGNRSVGSIIFRERLEDLKDRHLQRLQIFHVLSRETEADVPLLSGRIDGDKIRRFATVLPDVATLDGVFLCGPGTLIKDARDTLMELGVGREKIHFEYFRAGADGAMAGRRTTTKPAEAVAPLAGAEAVAIIDGTRHTFIVEAGQHVVDAALKAGIRVPYSCKGGMCCTCRAKVLEGAVRMERNFSLEPWEMDAGFVLTCQALPTTDKVVFDFDQV